MLQQTYIQQCTALLCSAIFYATHVANDNNNNNIYLHHKEIKDKYIETYKLLNKVHVLAHNKEKIMVTTDKITLFIHGISIS